jgi:DASS family divalent anion:Na+ symporter
MAVPAEKLTSKGNTPNPPSKNKEVKKSGLNIKNLLITIAVGLVIWFIPTPEGLDPKAWHLLAIFAATIVGFIIKPLPMGPMSIAAITLTAITGILTPEVALSGFSNTTIWLIVVAFFISRGFIKTGLGSRIAYIFVKAFGKKTLGLSYALLFSDLVLSPATPSNTARGGGIIYPIARSLSETFGSKPGDGTEKKIGSFLTLTTFHGNNITSAMFMTAMAANPLAVTLAKDLGVNISWGGWAIAALVPGLLSLILIPWVIYKLNPPEIKETPDASNWATKKLAEMGSMSKYEKLMLLAFGVVLVLWIFGEDWLGWGATVVGLIGLTLLLFTQVLDWEDVKNEKGAWDTLVWFAALVMMASQLNTLGLIPWFSDKMGNAVSGTTWLVAFLILGLVYYYSHYIFASNTAHVSAMYSAFLGVMIAAGAPAMLSALLLAFFSNLFSGLTHYGNGPAAVLYGSGYVNQNKWWSTGFIISLVHIVVWLGIGTLWWKILGLW